jgi:uncharacterized membrane protein
MTATTAHRPWPAPHAPGLPWRFASVLDTPSGKALQWVLKRNCSLSPRQALAAYLALSTVSLLIALLAWGRGATLVLPFAGLEVLGLGAALLVYAAHATDRETLTLQHGWLQVEHRCGRRLDQTAFRAQQVRIEPSGADDTLLELSGQGRRASVGRYLQPHWRPALAAELRAALRRADGLGLELK